MTDRRQIFSDIYDQYVEKIYRFIYLKVGSPDIAEDLTSEAFLRGWTSYQGRSVAPGIDGHGQGPGNQSEIKNLPAFLYQIARNLVIDHYRQKEKFPVVSIENSVITDPRIDLENRSALGSDIEMVRQALSRLKEDYQNVIIWHYLDDISVPEVAELLGKSEAATRVLLSRGLKELKKQLPQTG